MIYYSRTSYKPENKIEIKNYMSVPEEGVTIVFFSDGSKTVCKTVHGDTYDLEKGILLCILKRQGIRYEELENFIEEGKLPAKNKAERHHEPKAKTHCPIKDYSNKKLHIGDIVRLIRNGGCQGKGFALSGYKNGSLYIVGDEIGDSVDLHAMSGIDKLGGSAKKEDVEKVFDSTPYQLQYGDVFAYDPKMGVAYIPSDEFFDTSTRKNLDYGDMLSVIYVSYNLDELGCQYVVKDLDTNELFNYSNIDGITYMFNEKGGEKNK